MKINLIIIRYYLFIVISIDNIGSSIISYISRVSKYITYIMKSINILVLVFFLSACNEMKQQTDTSQASNSAPETIVSKNLESKNSIVVNESIVLFMMPDTTEINEMQSKYSEDIYAEIIADMTWYPGMAGMVLDSLSIQNQNFNKDSIIIEHNNKSETILIRKELDGDMVLIHPNKKPIVAYSVDFDKNQVLKYFDKGLFKLI